MESGFEIYGKFYPVVESFALGDPVLIRDLTGLDFVSFVEAQESLVAEIEEARQRGDVDSVQMDPVVLIGLVGVAVWHVNTTWRRDKVARWVQQLPNECLTLMGDEEEADDESPPAETLEGKAAGGTPADSRLLGAAIANPNGSGDPTSPIGAASP